MRCADVVCARVLAQEHASGARGRERVGALRVSSMASSRRPWHVRDEIDGYDNRIDVGEKLGEAGAHRGPVGHEEEAGKATERMRRGADRGDALGP